MPAQASISASNIEVDKFSAFLMFPFSFDNTDYKSKEPAEWFTSEHSGNNIKKWKVCAFELNKGGDYNEFVYFYPYIREILFSTKDKENENDNFYFLKWEKGQKPQVYLEINCGSGSRENTRVKLIDVYLHLYEIGVGLLIFEIENSNKRYLSDYLRFINLARRIYPPFVDNDLVLPGINKDNNSIESIKKGECPESISIIAKDENGEEKVVVEERFAKNLLVKKQPINSAIYLSNLIRYFLDIDNGSKRFLYENSDYLPIIDDRSRLPYLRGLQKFNKNIWQWRGCRD